jgi:hypothetical protein
VCRVEAIDSKSVKIKLTTREHTKIFVLWNEILDVYESTFRVVIQRVQSEMCSEKEGGLVLTSQEDEKIVFTDHFMNMLSVGLPTGHRFPPPPDML